VGRHRSLAAFGPPGEPPQKQGTSERVSRLRFRVENLAHAFRARSSLRRVELIWRRYRDLSPPADSGFMSAAMMDGSPSCQLIHDVVGGEPKFRVIPLDGQPGRMG